MPPALLACAAWSARLRACAAPGDRLRAWGRLLPVMLLASWLAGCAGWRPAVPERDAPPAVEPPARWAAPLPHGGSALALADWWAGFGDPLLTRLIAAAQAASPGTVSANARLLQARLGLEALAGLTRPRFGLQGGKERERLGADPASATTRQLLAVVSWEPDLFGAAAAAREAAMARADAADLEWHESRTLVAVEVAQLYVLLRGCEAEGDLIARHSARANPRSS